jgi:hypothetical protein
MNRSSKIINNKKTIIETFSKIDNKFELKISDLENILHNLDLWYSNSILEETVNKIYNNWIIAIIR